MVLFLSLSSFLHIFPSVKQLYSWICIIELELSWSWYFLRAQKLVTFVSYIGFEVYLVSLHKLTNPKLKHARLPLCNDLCLSFKSRYGKFKIMYFFLVQSYFGSIKFHLFPPSVMILSILSSFIINEDNLGDW